MNTTATPVSPLAAPAAVARQALQLAQRVLDLAKAFAKPHDMCQANTQVARCLKALHELSSAESHLDKALGWSALIPCVDVRVDLLCELSELAVSQAEAAHGHDDPTCQGALERARTHAFEAAQLAGQTTDAHWEVKVLLRVSDVFNRCGNHDDAAQLQNRAIALLGLQPADAPAGGEPAIEGWTAAAPAQLM